MSLLRAAEQADCLSVV